MIRRDFLLAVFMLAIAQSIVTTVPATAGGCDVAPAGSGGRGSAGVACSGPGLHATPNPPQRPASGD